MNARMMGALVLIAVAAALRLLPHPANLSPIAAMALFGGATFARRELGFLIPLAAMFISDMVLGFHDQMVSVYLSIALVAGLGFWVKENRSIARVATAAVTGSVLFFLITNFSVWLTSGMYEKSMAGLALCFTAALPFFQNSLTGDLFFTGAFFGVWVLMEKALPQPQNA